LRTAVIGLPGRNYPQTSSVSRAQILLFAGRFFGRLLNIVSSVFPIDCFLP